MSCNKYFGFLVIFCFLISFGKTENQHGADLEDNEFAEFEDFDEGTEQDTVSQPPPVTETPTKKQDEPKLKQESESQKKKQQADEFAKEFDDDGATVEVEGETEFETYDPEEFEGLEGDDTIWENDRKIKKGAKPELKIANVPLHVRSWDKFYIEILMCFGIGVYILNFFMGKYMNSTIASGWFKIHKEFLESQFELVGDDVQNKNAVSTLQLVKESEHIFTLWCSGRVCVEGMLVELRLLKRQDLVSIIADKMKPGKDQVSISITLEDMDPFVLVVGNKKSIANLQKNMQDVVYYCIDKMRPADKYDLPDNMCIASELWGEVANILDVKVRKIIKENEQFFDYLHISDQFSGPKPMDQEEQPDKPKTTKQLTVVLNMHCEGRNPLQADIVKMLPLMKMTLYLADKIRRFRLSKESKAKADKNRQKVEMAYLKLTHAKRQEEAQIKKEEKDKAMKERIMNEEDPEKQRKLEEIQHRRELKRKDKKMFKSKQMKVKMM
ncbi:PAT complex subunit CCDC47-like [Styela clava]